MKLKKIISLLLTTLICTSFIPAYASTTDKTWITDDVWISGDINISIIDTDVTVRNTITTNSYEYIKDLYANTYVIIAGYNDNNYIGCEALNCSFQPEFTFNFSDITAFSLDKANKIKVFLWDATGDLKPFCNDAKKTLNNVTYTNYCIITRLWLADDNSYKVEILNQYGQRLIYPIANETELNEITALLGLDSTDNYSYEYENFKQTPEKCVALYSLTKNKFHLESGLTAINEDSTGLIYKSATTKLSAFKIDRDTIIIDLSEHLTRKKSPVYTATISDFKDGNAYDAHLYDKNDRGSYNFVIITNSISRPNAESPLAIIKSCDGASNIENYYKYSVFYDGVEDSFYTDAILTEGDIVMYPKTSNKQVESKYVKMVFDMTENTTYETMAHSVLAEMLAISHIDDSTLDVTSYSGFVFEADRDYLSIFSTYRNGISHTYVLDEWVLSYTNTSEYDANTYVYDFEKPANIGIRVTDSLASSSERKFRPIYTSSSWDSICWDNAKNEQVCPLIAIVRDSFPGPTDVFYFIGEWDY